MLLIYILRKLQFFHLTLITTFLFLNSNTPFGLIICLIVIGTLMDIFGSMIVAQIRYS